ncbi:hypothetical protein JP0492_13690 [Helicobacter pylori]
MQENQTHSFKCPKCQAPIDVNEVLYKQIELENQSRFLAQQKTLEQKEEALKEREKEQKAKFDDAVKQASALALQDERAKIIEEARKKRFFRAAKGLGIVAKRIG